MTRSERFERATDALLSLGRPIFGLAIIGLGVETLVCAHTSAYLYPLPGNPRFQAIQVLPFLPAIPWLGQVFGVVLAVCGFGLLFQSTLRGSAMAVGGLLLACTLILEAPRYAAVPGSMGLRTLLFEPLAMGMLAWLAPGLGATPAWLERGGRYLLGLSYIVFGVDHFLALALIGVLIPPWIPWHVFWIEFFGAGFIATGVSVGFDILLRWSAGCIGGMFAIWVFTLHLPTVLGTYTLPGQRSAIGLWSSFLIAVAMWGGAWALAHGRGAKRRGCEAGGIFPSLGQR